MPTYSGSKILSFALILLVFSRVFCDERLYIVPASSALSTGLEPYESINPVQLGDADFFYFTIYSCGAFAGIDAIGTMANLWAGRVDELKSLEQVWEKHLYSKPIFGFTRWHLGIAKNRFGFVAGWEAKIYEEIKSTPLMLPLFYTKLENKILTKFGYAFGLGPARFGAFWRVSSRTFAYDHRHIAELRNFRAGDIEQKNAIESAFDIGASLRYYPLNFELLGENIGTRRISGSSGTSERVLFSAGLDWVSYVGVKPFVMKWRTGFEFYDLTNELDISWKRRIRFSACGFLAKDRIQVIVGINDGYPTLGLKFAIIPIILGYTYTTYERGYEAGQAPLETHLLYIGFFAKRERER